MISRDAIQEMFDSVRANPKVKWNIDQICLWGYFFTDHDFHKLQFAANELTANGYQFVEIFKPSPGNDDHVILTLHVEREELHTVETLDFRNLELYAFADRHQLDSYDGMDVGPAKIQA